jgi:hypothetical protein
VPQPKRQLKPKPRPRQRPQADPIHLRRRFVFRGNAAAFGGRYVRPDDITFDTPAASSLPVVGGRSASSIEGAEAKRFSERFKGHLSFEAASTLAEGSFDDRAQAIELTHSRVREQELAISTRVRAEIKTLTVGHEQRLRVGRMVAELRSKSPGDVGEPPIAVGDIAIDDLTIDGFRLKIVLDSAVFNELDTQRKLLGRCAKADFAKKYGHQVFMRPRTTGRGPTAVGRGHIHGTLVTKIGWDGNANPRATIVGNHVVVVKDFGKIFLGEILVSDGARRVTLLRLELGSNGGGQAGGPDVDTNGSYSP